VQLLDLKMIKELKHFTQKNQISKE